MYGGLVPSRRQIAAVRSLISSIRQNCALVSSSAQASRTLDSDIFILARMHLAAGGFKAKMTGNKGSRMGV